MRRSENHAFWRVADTTGYPTAFPRAGSVKILDDPRFTAWHHGWTKGVPSGMHFHDKDFVVAFRYDSSRSILTADGTSRVSQVSNSQQVELPDNSGQE
jgi:hypothetical protein